MLRAMRHPIDPKVDCVFKALLGAESNRDLLIHFLNAILGADLPGPDRRGGDPEPLQRKGVPRRQAHRGRRQGPRRGRAAVSGRDPTANHRDLPARILYGWADLYSAQIGAARTTASSAPPTRSGCWARPCWRMTRTMPTGSGCATSMDAPARPRRHLAAGTEQIRRRRGRNRAAALAEVLQRGGAPGRGPCPRGCRPRR